MTTGPPDTAAVESQSRDQPATLGRLALAQAQRRQRAIGAALELAAERGHPDAIQMRDIAERSNVAIGTIYKYFSSKDQILGIALVEWMGQLELDPSSYSADELPLVERAVVVLRRASESIEREPELARTLFLAASSSAGRVVGLEHDLSRMSSRILAGALAGMDDVTRRGVQRVLTHVWYSSLTRWVNGWQDLSEIGNELEFACRWLISGPPVQVGA